MVFKHSSRLTALIFLTSILAQCGAPSSIDTSTAQTTGEADSGATTDAVISGNVSQLTVDADGNTNVTFDSLPDDSDVVFVIFSYNETSSSEAFSLGSSENVNYLRHDSWLQDVEEESEEDITEEFHLMLRDFEAEIEPDLPMAEPDQKTARFLTTGSQKNFKVLNSFSSSTGYDTVTATLRYQTDDFEFYVDDQDEESLSDDDLEELAQDFAARIPDERALFGEESDVNGDGKFAVLFTRTVNGLASGSGGIVTGFFYAIDLFDDSDYSLSNEMEVYYSFVPDPDGDFGAAVSKSFAISNILPGVLVHEYQHMINFNQHYFVSGGSAEMGFLNEGLSHLAEDIYSIDAGGYMADHGIENPARVSGYLNNISNICFTCGSSLNQRGGSYLFLRYLYEQAELGYIPGAASGAELIENLLTTSKRGVDNIVQAAFGSNAADNAFKTLLGRFSLAVYFSDTDLIDDERYDFQGINLRGAQNDNRGTVLNGPAVQDISAFPFTDTIQGNSISYVQISSAMITDNGGTVPLSFSTEADFGGYVIHEE